MDDDGAPEDAWLDAREALDDDDTEGLALGCTVYVEPPMVVVLPCAASVTAGAPDTDTTVAVVFPAGETRDEDG